MSEVENEDYAAFMRRGIRAMGRRASEDVDALVLLKGLADECDKALRTAVQTLHDDRHYMVRKGFSYGEIAQRLGVTRQAVQKRWGGRSSVTTEEGPERGEPGRAADR